MATTTAQDVVSPRPSRVLRKSQLPELEYAVLCDFVRPEPGIAHVIAAGIDTIWAAQVPTAHNFGVVLQVEFTRNECGRPHRIELHLQDTDGAEVATVNGSVTPTWDASLPAGWLSRAQLAMNLGLVFPNYGIYALEVLLNDASAKSLRLRVVPGPKDVPETGTADEG